MKNPIRRIQALYWRHRLLRCECGRLIWPWQPTAQDPELGTIHFECASIAEEWEYRAVAYEPGTKDVYDSTRPFATFEEAKQAGKDWGIDDHLDMPRLVLGVQLRTKAGPWEPTL